VRCPRPLAACLASLGLLASGACGWHAGLQAPAGAGSVGIDVFTSDRKILERDLEPRLNSAMTRALVDLIDVPLEHPKRADLVIHGEIVEFRRRAGVRNDDNDLVETGVLIEATARLVDRRTGEILVPTKKARVWSSYGLDGTTAVEQGDVAQERALRHIAEILVLDLFRPEEENLPPEVEPESPEPPAPPAPERR
jgi:hypothetical protein